MIFCMMYSSSSVLGGVLGSVKGVVLGTVVESFILEGLSGTTGWGRDCEGGFWTGLWRECLLESLGECYQGVGLRVLE